MQERPYLCQYNETQSNYDPTEGILDTDLNSLFIDPWGGLTNELPVTSGFIRRQTRAASASSGSDRMLLRRRRRVRPLGLVVLDSRLETQVEKAVFKTNLRLLTQMVSSHRSTVLARPNTPVHGNAAPTTEYERNNARAYRFHTQIRDRVVSAGGERRTGTGSIYDRYERPLCSRQSHMGDNLQHTSHCEVLGPYYCTDCTQIRKRTKSAHQQSTNFPNVEVHPRSLVAPEKLEKLLIRIPQASMEHQSDNKMKANGGGTTQIVVTGNDIYSRLRQTHKEQGNRVCVKNAKAVPKKSGLITPNMFEEEKRRREISQTNKSQKGGKLAVPRANTPMIRFDIPTSR